MLLNEINQTFTQADRKQKGSARRCVDGTVTGRNRCVGYCNYTGHPGFLTQPLTEKHGCDEKNCLYYAPKESGAQNRCPHPKPERELLRRAETLTAEMEGLRLLRCEFQNGAYRIFYAAAARYDLIPVVDKLSGEFRGILQFREIHCDFETAAKLIFRD